MPAYNRITEATKKRIHELLAQGLTRSQVAERLGLGLTTVHAIARTKPN